jgi:hypothetical protein
MRPDVYDRWSAERVACREAEKERDEAIAQAEKWREQAYTWREQAYRALSAVIRANDDCEYLDECLKDMTLHRDTWRILADGFLASGRAGLCD